MKPKIELLLEQEELIHKNIRFADQKATILLTINGALLFSIISAKPDLQGLWLFLFCGVCFGLLISILICFWIIIPRGESLEFNAESFEKKLEELVQDRAKINTDKYRWLHRLVPLCMFVWFASFITFFGYIFFS